MDTNVLVWYAGVEVCVCVSVCVYKERMWKGGKNIEDSGHKRDAPS